MSPGADPHPPSTPPPEADLAALYDAHAHALHAFALSLTHSPPDAKDLLQDLFVRLARHPDLLLGVRNPRAFLLRLLHNAAIDSFRRRHCRAHLSEPLSEATDGFDHSAPSESASAFAASPDPDEQAFRDALAHAIAELPTDQRAVIHLKLWEGLTFDAIAHLLDIPLNTAASRYRYGMDKLRTLLRPLYREIQ
jgi:RNA polymerase sigma-70 factor (ECF subfamily)